jgi:SHS2 domain-containing protein
MPKPANKTYTLLDHTADLRVCIVGSDLADLFQNAGLALFDLIVESDAPATGENVELRVSGEDLPDLLINFLRELLFLWTGDEKVVTMVEVKHISDTTVSARIAAERYAPNRHHIQHEIKAVTYHQIDVTPVQEGWQAVVVFDI